MRQVWPCRLAISISESVTMADNCYFGKGIFDASYQPFCHEETRHLLRSSFKYSCLSLFLRSFLPLALRYIFAVGGQMTVLGLSQGDTKGEGGRRRRKAETREEGRLAGASDTHEGEDEGGRRRRQDCLCVPVLLSITLPATLRKLWKLT